MKLRNRIFELFRFKVGGMDRQRGQIVSVSGARCSPRIFMKDNANHDVQKHITIIKCVHSFDLRWIIPLEDPSPWKIPRQEREALLAEIITAITINHPIFRTLSIITMPHLRILRCKWTHTEWAIPDTKWAGIMVRLLLLIQTAALTIRLVVQSRTNNHKGTWHHTHRIFPPGQSFLLQD